MSVPNLPWLSRNRDERLRTSMGSRDCQTSMKTASPISQTSPSASLADSKPSYDECTSRLTRMTKNEVLAFDRTVVSISIPSFYPSYFHDFHHFQVSVPSCLYFTTPYTRFCLFGHDRYSLRNLPIRFHLKAFEYLLIQRRMASTLQKLGKTKTRNLISIASSRRPSSLSKTDLASRC